MQNSYAFKFETKVHMEPEAAAEHPKDPHINKCCLKEGLPSSKNSPQAAMDSHSGGKRALRTVQVKGFVFW